jgi:hypothetical protein
MRYMINSKTKQHVIVNDDYVAGGVWVIKDTDSEGWIKHTGKECPLPDDVLCDTKWDDGQGGPRVAAYHWKWHDPSITHYRPIIAEKVQEPEPTKLNSPRRCSRCFTDDMSKHHPHCPDRVCAARSVLPPQYDPADLEYEKQRAEKEAERKHMEIKEAELKRMMLLDRLKAAHKAAQTIPDLEAELRKVLGSMGYDLVARSPFVEPEAAVETTQDKVIAGALFDLLGFLTTRDKPTSFGATRNASPAVELLQEWANKRGLDLDGADVEGWHSRPSKDNAEHDNKYAAEW